VAKRSAIQRWTAAAVVQPESVFADLEVDEEADRGVGVRVSE